MREPQEVTSEENEEIVQRVAAIDVAKASGMVCTRIPHPSKPDRRLTKVWTLASTTNAIMELADHLAGQGIERIVIESTSDYWRPFLYLLQAHGLCVWLVNARDVKNVPGRPKTSSTPCGWPSWPNAAWCAPRSSLQPPSASCVTTPGCGST
jgi:transposase